MKARLNQVSEIAIGEDVFHVRKYRALASARISGNVLATLAPLLGGAGSALGGWLGDDSDSGGLLDQDLGTVLPALADGLMQLDGKKLETILKELLIDEGCISYDGDVLTQATLDELFCGDLMGLLRLAFEVIKLNFSGLFTSLGSLFGSREEGAEEERVLT